MFAAPGFVRFRTALVAGSACLILAIGLPTCDKGNPSGPDPDEEPVVVVPSAPGAPSGVTAELAGAVKIVVRWRDDSEVSHYIVYRSQGDASTFDSLDKTSDTMFVDDGLETGTRYNYRIKAVDENGESPFSNDAAARTDIETPAIEYAGTIAVDSIRVTWGTIQGARSYKVYRLSPEGSEYQEMAEEFDTTHVDYVLCVRGTYQYRVDAIDYNFKAVPSSIVACQITQGWAYVGSPGFSADSSLNVTLQMDNGVPYVSFIDMSEGQKATVMRNSGGTWEFMGAPGFSVGKVDFVSMTVHNGVPAVSFCDYGNSFKAVVKYCVDGVWTTQTDSICSTGAVDFPNLVVENGAPYVAYVDYPNSRKITVVAYDGTQWLTLGLPGFSLSKIYSLISMSVYQGVPHVASVGSRDDFTKVFVWRYNPLVNSWEVLANSSVSSGSALNPSLTLYEGLPYVAYTDVGQGGGISVARFNGSAWENLGSPGFTGIASAYPTICVDNGIAYLAYLEADHENPTYRVCVQRYDDEWEYLGSPGYSVAVQRSSNTFPLVPTVSIRVHNGVPYLAFTDRDHGVGATVVKFE